MRQKVCHFQRFLMHPFLSFGSSREVIHSPEIVMVTWMAPPPPVGHSENSKSCESNSRPMPSTFPVIDSRMVYRECLQDVSWHIFRILAIWKRPSGDLEFGSWDAFCPISMFFVCRSNTRLPAGSASWSQEPEAQTMSDAEVAALVMPLGSFDIGQVAINGVLVSYANAPCTVYIYIYVCVTYMPALTPPKPAYMERLDYMMLYDLDHPFRVDPARGSLTQH